MQSLLQILAPSSPVHSLRLQLEKETGMTVGATEYRSGEPVTESDQAHDILAARRKGAGKRGLGCALIARDQNRQDEYQSEAWGVP